jgi:hypothetical protein
MEEIEIGHIRPSELTALQLESIFGDPSALLERPSLALLQSQRIEAALRILKKRKRELSAIWQSAFFCVRARRLKFQKPLKVLSKCLPFTSGCHLDQKEYRARNGGLHSNQTAFGVG